MKLIVGLGNPGNQYNFTRHNFGFLSLDYYAKIKNHSWQPTPKYNAIFFKEGSTIFIKPQTFYNEVGTAAQSFAHFYKIPPENILALCDDFYLTFGTIRFREKGSAGGNNGLKSLIKELNTEAFPRLRLGTANDDLRRKIGDTDFVLSKFTPEEKESLPAILNQIATRIDDFIKK
ncbi:aminoacyl-tRNA hydrolase [Candidatus Saccharibacteria bacterium]|nr:aminoacyl-tRNA hydrolase [Candidatus Saccharibacteria bacterium]